MVSSESRDDLKRTPHNEALWQLGKQFNDPNFREVCAKIVSNLAPGHTLFEHLQFDENEKRIADHLSQLGFVNLESQLGGAEIEAITGHLNGIAEWDLEETLRHFKLPDILRAPHLLDLACNPSILRLVAAYLQTAPTIIDLCAWWSDPTPSPPFGAQIPHRDRDDFRFCKLFLYLTEVGPEDGPHMFLPGSHSRKGMVALCEKHKVDQSYVNKAFAKVSRKQADWITDIFGSSFVEFTGSSGTMFMVDTFGYHFGKVPRQHPRLVFEAVYAQLGYGYRYERLSQTHDIQLPDHILADSMARYACRLIGQPPSQ